VLHNHSNASMNAISSNIEHLHYWCAYYSHNYFESLALDIGIEFHPSFNKTSSVCK
jgi:hypothetical protein